MKKIILIAALILYAQVALAFSYTLQISEDELQAKVSDMMPIEKKKFFITVILSNPHIDLAVGNNEIGLFSHIEILAPGGIKGEGKAKISGSLSYDSEKSEFYFKNPKIVNLQSENIPPNLLPKVKQIAQLAASQFLSVRPIYKLTDKNLKQRLAKAVLQSVKVEKNHLLVGLSLF